MIVGFSQPVALDTQLVGHYVNTLGVDIERMRMDVATEEIAAATTQNAERLFGLGKKEL